jgi:uncharacterized protein
LQLAPSPDIKQSQFVLRNSYKSPKIYPMADQLDYSQLDDPLLLQFVFFPRSDWTPAPEDATDHQVIVENGISIFCRFYPVDTSGPSILYFHGNGEVACEYDWIARFFNEIGVNLFVADYRGYGKSDGQPTFTNTAADCHQIFNYFRDMLDSSGYTEKIFVMGRSLGSQPALDLAANHPEEMNGLIIESGFAQNGRLMRYLGLPVSIPNLDDFEKTALERIRQITMPALFIHGEQDVLIPPTEAETIYENIGSEDKKLLIIRGGDHNTLMLVGLQQYFDAIKEFITGG